MSKSSHAVRVLLHRIGVAGPARARAFGGTGASPCGSRARGSVLAVAAVTVALALAVGAAPAGASGVLQIEPELQEPVLVYATRAHIGVEVQTGSLEVKWRAEYATSESGPWTVAGSGTSEELKTEEGGAGGFLHSGNIFLEGPGEVGDRGFGYANALLRYLAPSTTYYARFHVESSANEAAERTFKFTTTAVSKPEIVYREHTMSLPREPGEAFLGGGATSPTTAVFNRAQVDANGAETTYYFEYAPAEGGHAPAEDSPSWAPFTPGATGTVVATPFSVAEGFADPDAKLTGLTPETTYYARARASNDQGEAVEVSRPFTTQTAKPQVGEPEIRNITGESAHVKAGLNPHGAETEWRFEDAKSAAGPWVVLAGAEGTISQAEAEAGDYPDAAARLTGLGPATTYYVRLFAKNAAGEEGVNNAGEPISTEKQGIASFKTFGAPAVSTLAVHGLDGEALRIVGSVNPNSVPTSAEQTITIGGAPTGGTFTLTFKGQTTAPIAFDAPSEGPTGVQGALEALSTLKSAASSPGTQAPPPNIFVTGGVGGPYTVLFSGKDAEVSEPQIEADASGLTPSSTSTVKVATVLQGGEGYDTHYHFEFVSQKQFEEPGGVGGFARATSTPEVDLGSGDSIEYVGQDLPVLTLGETYRFRLVARSTFPGDPVVDGEERSLTAPVAVEQGPEEACSNAALRTGPSALLPDCRAYEQLTPGDKEGAQEIFNYGGGFVTETVAGGDGDRFMYSRVNVKYGSGPDAGQGPYVFARGEAGWQMTASAVQPEAGVSVYEPLVFNSDLTQVAFDAKYGTSSAGESPQVEYRVGPPGGPYTKVASVPRAGAAPGWVAASEGFSKLILMVEDRKLVVPETTTKSGDDLYEYSSGALRQVNVGVGSCGATIAHGYSSTNPTNEAGLPVTSVIDSRHAVSADGSRVFFEAVPGSDCEAAQDLYVRVNGTETVDLGAYRFVAANKEGSEALLEKSNGENPGLYLYKTGSAPEFLPSSGIVVSTEGGGGQLIVSEDLSTVYILAGNDLYRYDVPGKSLGFVTQITKNENADPTDYSVSPEGRYFYFDAEAVAGLPGGGPVLVTPHAVQSTGLASQAYRYDSTEKLIQCISCASSYDPKPRLSANLAVGDNTSASANGEFVFFDTPAALLPADVDGEVAPEGIKEPGAEHVGEGPASNVSLSSDVYEWRGDGVDGCSRVLGCLALVTSGSGGFMNILLGTVASGDDVFFATKEALVPQDAREDGATENIYDARIDGGFPEPAHPVECKGDSCSTPAPFPLAQTPATLTLAGSGNLAPEVKPRAVAKAKPKPKKKSKKKVKSKSKQKRKRPGKRAKSHKGGK